MKKLRKNISKNKVKIQNSKIYLTAFKGSFIKLNPITLIKNPIMFTVEIVALLTTFSLFICFIEKRADLNFIFQIVGWLWFTVLFANFAESLAEGRGKAQAEALKNTRTDTQAKLITNNKNNSFHIISASKLKKGDVVLVEAGEIVPSDGDVIEGIASIDESAITGESAPVIRESGGDRSAVTGGTVVLSDWVKVKITATPGSSFLDRMISLVEGAVRQKTPNEIALNILLVGLTLIFLFVVVSIPFFVRFANGEMSVTFLVALFVTLIPTTIGALLSAIGIAGMDRLIKFNVLAKSGRAVEAAGDVDTLLLDKTGTITLGNRQATEFVAMSGCSHEEMVEAAFLSSYGDETPEGRSIVSLAQKENIKFTSSNYSPKDFTLIKFTAQTRISGIDLPENIQIRKGAIDSIKTFLKNNYSNKTKKTDNDKIEVQEIKEIQELEISEASKVSEEIIELEQISNKIARLGGTPLAIIKNEKLLGVVYLKDIVKKGIRERFSELRNMGIRTIMITGDNPLTASTIAAESGVDDYLAEAKPEDKLKLIRDEQLLGKLVAMCGDGTNDAPALAQADVGVAMQTGTQAAREAGNMVDLDSDPTKLIEIVMIGKQLLITRGALTTFSIANDIAKYFAIIPAIFAAFYPSLKVLNIMNLNSPQSAILSALIFNALIIIFLIPLSLKGVKYRISSAANLLKRNLLIFGLGGMIVPFIGIKLIDIIIINLGWI